MNLLPEVSPKFETPQSAMRVDMTPSAMWEARSLLEVAWAALTWELRKEEQNNPGPSRSFDQAPLTYRELLAEAETLGADLVATQVSVALSYVLLRAGGSHIMSCLCVHVSGQLSPPGPPGLSISFLFTTFR